MAKSVSSSANAPSKAPRKSSTTRKASTSKEPSKILSRRSPIRRSVAARRKSSKGESVSKKIHNTRASVHPDDVFAASKKPDNASSGSEQSKAANNRRRWFERDQYRFYEPIGINLVNNHCYRNAVYIALFHIPEFVELLKRHKLICMNRDLCLACPLTDLMIAYWDSENSILDEATNRPLKDLTAFIKSFDDTVEALMISLKDTEGNEAQFRRLKTIPRLNFANVESGRQDAAEFMSWILAVLEHHDFNFTDREELRRLMNSQTLGRWQCDQCSSAFLLRDGAVANNMGVTTITSWKDREGNPMIGEKLKTYLRHHWFQPVLELECSSAICAEDSFQAETSYRTVKERLVMAAEYLIFQTSAFDFASTRDGEEGKGTKRNGEVKIPLWLDLGKFAHDDHKVSQKGFQYKLWSTIYHQGSAGAGHYKGVYGGRTGIRRVDSEKVHFATTAHLTKSYKAPPHELVKKDRMWSQHSDFLRQECRKAAMRKNAETPSRPARTTRTSQKAAAADEAVDDPIAVDVEYSSAFKFVQDDAESTAPHLLIYKRCK